MAELCPLKGATRGDKHMALGTVGHLPDRHATTGGVLPGRALQVLEKMLGIHYSAPATMGLLPLGQFRVIPVNRAGFAGGSHS